MRVFPIFKRAASGSGDGPGEVDARFNVRPGVRIGSVLEALGARISAGARLATAPISAAVPQRFAARVATSATGSAPASSKPAVRMGPIPSGSPSAAQKPAANIVQTTTNLNGLYGANASSSTGPAWTNIANAHGPHDGALATRSGQATVITTSVLDLSFANFANKTALAMSQVQLKLYWRLAGTLLNNGSFSAYYSLNSGGSFTQLGATQTGDFDALGAPSTFDVTAAVAGDWSKLDGLVVRFTAVIPAGAIGQTASVDAAELLVAASRTEVN